MTCNLYVSKVVYGCWQVQEITRIRGGVMKKRIFFLSIIAALVHACGTTPPAADIDRTKPNLSVTVTFNSNLYGTMMFKKMYPTYAIWIEDVESGVVKTVYVTGKAGKDSWIMADKRPSSVPVWYGARKREKTVGTTGAVDAVTGATPSGNTFTHSIELPADMVNGRLAVFMEGNISFDYNEHYPKKAAKGEPGYSDVNGQPSVVWKAVLEAGTSAAEKDLAIVGHGHVLGEDNRIHTDMITITTAKEIFLYTGAHYSPGERR